MGYRVENYSLNELHRISVPGAVAPSIFWVLPVGNWDGDELENVWHCFTERRGPCHDFGLLLVKERGRRQGRASDVSLASVGAKLADLMPESCAFCKSISVPGGLPEGANPFWGLSPTGLGRLG
jgi:hypothetical protein